MKLTANIQYLTELRESRTKDMDRLSWSKKIPFFRNTYLLRSIFLAYLASILIFSIIIAAIFIADGDADQLGQIALPMLGVFLFLLVLFLFSTWIAIGNKYAVRYTINKQGVTIAGTKDKAKDIRKLAITAGILTANPRLLGSGLLVRKDIIQIPWKDMNELSWDTARNKLKISCSFWNQVGLHYPRERQKDIEKLIEKYWNG